MNRTNTLKKKSYIHLLLLLFPILTAAIFSLLLPPNQADFLLWWTTLFVIGIGAYPWCVRLFPNFTDKGYGLAKTLGVLIPAFLLWTICHTGLVPYTRWTVLLFAGCFAVSGWLWPKTRANALQALMDKEGFLSIIIQEMLFILLLVILCGIKAIYPDINGEEKFMDFAFYNTLLRTDTLPSPDPWMAGETINYYYFGQYIYSFLGKATGITPGVSYTLSMCSALVLPFIMLYSLGKNLITHLLLAKNGYPLTTDASTVSTNDAKTADNRGKQPKSTPKLVRDAANRRILRNRIHIVSEIAGFFTGFAAIIAGNSHAFFYEDSSIGNPILSFFSSLGINVGRTTDFFYPNSTRFIGHNPDTKAADYIGQMDYTIHEFPIYSYIVGDLHAHVISLMIVLLLTACLFSIYIGVRRLDDRSTLKKNISENLPLLILSGALLGMALMCNYWDFIMYFVVTAMVIFIATIYGSDKTFGVKGICALLFFLAGTGGIYLLYSTNPIVHLLLQTLLTTTLFFWNLYAKDAFSRTAFYLSGLFTTALLAALPFNLNFQMISGYVLRTDRHTSAYQFLILWGVHLLFAVLLLVLIGFLRQFRRNPLQEKTNPLKRFFEERYRSDVFVSGLAVCSFLLLLFPEIFYVADIYGSGHQRTNTMFKFTYAAFVILSQVMIYTAFRIGSHLVQKPIPSKRRQDLSIVLRGTAIITMALLLLIPFYYPFASIPQRNGTRTYQGLDGTLYLANRNSRDIPNKDNGDLADYAEAINWFQENVSGTPVICEVNGDSYSDHNLVSSYTGLPTIYGWQNHEWLWRFQGIPDESGKLVANPDKPDIWKDILTPRENDVKKIYTSASRDEILAILEKHEVQYLIVGNLEKAVYPNIDDELLQSLGTVVFERETLYVIAV